MTNYNSLAEIREAIAAKKTSTTDLANQHLAEIEKRKNLNAFLDVYANEALQQAKAADADIAANKPKKLSGMVLGIKDVLAYQGHGLQASSKILDGFKSVYTGTAVQRLINEGAVIIGRQNCDEFAMGSSTENSAFGPSLNADDETRVGGGSSGGSAVAVQANLCQASIGSDTGGSVRQPAAFCNVVGLKPTYSRISRFGLIAYASSFDCIGPIGKSVDDVALLLEVMAGPDDNDATVSHKPVLEYSKLLDKPKKLKIAYLREGLENEVVAKDIRNKFNEKLEFLKSEGHTVEPIDFDLLKYALPTYYILTTAEASSNLARYDGVRYGYRSPNHHDLESMYKNTRAEGFGNEVKRRILLGTFVLSASYYDAFYTKAQKIRRLIRDSTADIFKKYDAFVMPTTPNPAFKLGEKTNDPIAMYLEDLFTVQANVAGVPAISVPMGFDSNGLAIGFQIMAGHFEEAKMLALAKLLYP